MIVFVHDWGSYFVVGALWNACVLNSFPAPYFTAVGQDWSFGVSSCTLGRAHPSWGLPWSSPARVLSSDGFHPHVPSVAWNPLPLPSAELIKPASPSLAKKNAAENIVWWCEAAPALCLLWRAVLGAE